jgi:single-stranded DNA-binding protein
VSFPLATSELIIKNVVKEERTEWHNIVLWRGLAELAQKRNEPDVHLLAHDLPCGLYE